MENVRVHDNTACHNHESHHVFTFDDIPPNKWRDHIVFFTAWMNANRQFNDILTVIHRFLSRLEGRLKE